VCPEFVGCVKDNKVLLPATEMMTLWSFQRRIRIVGRCRQLRELQGHKAKDWVKSRTLPIWETVKSNTLTALAIRVPVSSHLAN
jgi:hypothetical protein